MSKKYKISFIGSGNLAWNLASAVENAGHLINEIYSRNKSNAAALVSRLYDAQLKIDLNFSNSESNIIFICVKDDVIEEVVQEIFVPENCLVVHTSGTKPVGILNKFDNSGVFYPVQTFSKNSKVDFSKIPLCIECSNDIATQILSDIALSLSKAVFNLSSEQRGRVHLSAVFANNFCNHILGISSHLLQEWDLDPSLLDELIAETVNKSFIQDPFLIQTGPAARKDMKVLESHLHQLGEHPSYKNIYKAVSESIMKNIR